MRRDDDPRGDGGESIARCDEWPERMGTVSCIEELCAVGHERCREDFVVPPAVVCIGDCQVRRLRAIVLDVRLVGDRPVYVEVCLAPGVVRVYDVQVIARPVLNRARDAKLIVSRNCSIATMMQ